MLIGSIHWISFAFTGIHWHEAALIRHHPNSLAFIHILTLIHIWHTLTFIDIHWQSLTIIGIRWYWLRNSVVFFSIHQASSEFIGNHDIHWHWSCISWNNWHLWAFIRHHLHSLAFMGIHQASSEFIGIHYNDPKDTSRKRMFQYLSRVSSMTWSTEDICDAMRQTKMTGSMANVHSMLERTLGRYFHLKF